MIKILLVDDNPDKISDIKNLIDTFPEVNKDDLVVCTDIKSASIKLINDEQYDLLILDLYIPFEFGDNPCPENGIDFLNEIDIDDDKKNPFHIIGITAYSENADLYKNSFDNKLWHLIHYKKNEVDWKIALENKIQYLIKSKNKILQNEISKLNFDVAIITALREPELSHVLKLDIEWLGERYENDDMTLYHIGKITTETKNEIKIVAAAAPQMGMCAASVLSMKLIHKFRPKYIIMCGICAGVEGQVKMGDILINDESWDGASGKISHSEIDKKVFLPDPKHKVLNEVIKERFLNLKMSRKFLDEIGAKYTANKPESSLNVHIGPVASVPAVIQSDAQIAELKLISRKLLGVEMESYGVFYSASHCSDPKPIAISMKSVCDFANEKKNDFFQDYAAYTSANYMYQIIKYELDYK